ncbi:RIPOR family member 3 [Suncus etruscus]|uniref:RIPOR family member 3 n=1 Tax=Suncus etruscus TaxID=109475 RepID=UPI00210FA702|nr:RIPOR family member 3 [Suncus etruscus]
MSVRLRFLSSGDAAAMGAVGAMGRSASFAGYSSAQSRRISNSVRARMSTKSARMYGTLRKGAVCPGPRPQQVKKIFEALKRGLQEHLCVQQAELDYLSGCHKDTHRNSRLAFYYDLDKQTRAVDRHIRKMEFHISKVDELYEGYCVQCRLRDGACNMQRAFSGRPPSRASRDSVQELGRSLQECAEDMWLIEGALEVHLGEFHIRMKGLVGYARLCPGDQYEVLMRLGRQRWKLRGRIESDDSQTWDEEDKAFIPTLHDNLEIKVTELRGLSSLAVGAVTCDITEFFTTRPQVIVVDITELGTIKLQLEVLWNPLDAESCLVSPGLASKFSMGSRKGSLYNWTPPSTPSFRERYYLSVLQPLLPPPALPGTISLRSSLSYGDLRAPSQELPEMDSFSSEDPRDTETSTSASTLDVGFMPLVVGPDSSAEQGVLDEPLPPGLLPEIGDLSGGPWVEQPGWRNLGFGCPPMPGAPLLHHHLVSGTQQDQEEAETGDTEDKPQAVLEGSLQEVLDLLGTLEPAQPQLRELQKQVLGLRERCKPRVASRKGASAESLMECLLDSSAFLLDDLALFGHTFIQFSPFRKDRTVPPESAPSMSRELPAEVSELDMLLEVHLQVCKALLQKLASPNLSRMVQECLLEEAAQQKQVLETLSGMDSEKACTATAIEKIFPQATRRKGCLKLWRGCTEHGRVLACPAPVLLSQLKRMFVHRVRGKYPGQLEIACRRLLEQVLSCGGLLVTAGLPEDQTVTWFQFHSYLQRQRVSDLEKHFAQLTKEVTLVEELQCAGQAKAIRKLRGKRLGQLQPLPQTLRAWALLQLDGTPQTCRTASARLASAARNKSFREKALLFYTDALAGNEPRLQQAACMALQHLGAMESIDQIASLCWSELEDVRSAAREATLSFGEKGRLAFEKMDRICSEQREAALSQEPDIEITVF